MDDRTSPKTVSAPIDISDQHLLDVSREALKARVQYMRTQSPAAYKRMIELDDEKSLIIDAQYDARKAGRS